MDKHTCKFCFKSFGNGRALGGHMRSHVAANTKAASQLMKDSSSSPSESSSSSRDELDDVDAAKEMGMVMGPLGYGLRENPKKSFRLVDPEFSSTFPTVDASSAAHAAAAGSSIVVQDRESETESSRAPPTHRRRSKRARKAAAQPDPPPPEPEPVSSVSDTTPEEDVAISLMMLSRDIWAPMTKSDDQQSEHQQQFARREVEEEDDEDEDEIDIDASRIRNHPVKGRSKYQCGSCKKVFRSYQALGGHRASHKKTNGCVPPPPAKASAPASAQIQIHHIYSSEVNAGRLQHECPVCYRVFSSGQALGGHKRSHLTSSSAFTITVTSNSNSVPPPAPVAVADAASKYGESLIDLNLPAPMEDDAELSAVSDAEFVMVRSSQ